MAKKILFVDDDRDLVQNYEKVFRTAGYEFSSAHSGPEGLKKALAVRPDLIILDVVMETDTAGFEVFNQLRSRREESRYTSLREVPVVLLTGINQVTHSRFSLNEKQSFLPGINGIFTKPMKAEALIEAVKHLI